MDCSYRCPWARLGMAVQVLAFSPLALVSDEQRKFVIYQLLHALHHGHSRGVFYGNLKVRSNGLSCASSVVLGLSAYICVCLCVCVSVYVCVNVYVGVDVDVGGGGDGDGDGDE